MALAEELAAEVDRLFKSQWNFTKGRQVPTSDTSITFKNDGTHITATVLYADLADSTILVDQKPDWFAAEVYKAFLACAGKIVRSEGGEITAYDGDRIMAVYIGADQHDRAIRTAQKINAAVMFIINPALQTYPHAAGRGYVMKHVCGIDTSQLLVAKIGVRNASDLVWVGRAANYAAKLASEDDAFPTWVTWDAYEAATDRVKLEGGVGRNLWEPAFATKIPDQFLVMRSTSHWRVDGKV